MAPRCWQRPETGSTWCETWLLMRKLWHHTAPTNDTQNYSNAMLSSVYQMPYEANPRIRTSRPFALDHKGDVCLETLFDEAQLVVAKIYGPSCRPPACPVSGMSEGGECSRHHMCPKHAVILPGWRNDAHVTSAKIHSHRPRHQLHLRPRHKTKRLLLPGFSDPIEASATSRQHIRRGPSSWNGARGRS